MSSARPTTCAIAVDSARTAARPGNTPLPATAPTTAEEVDPKISEIPEKRSKPATVVSSSSGTLESAPRTKMSSGAGASDEPVIFASLGLTKSTRRYNSGTRGGLTEYQNRCGITPCWFN